MTRFQLLYSRRSEVGVGEQSRRAEAEQEEGGVGKKEKFELERREAYLWKY